MATRRTKEDLIHDVAYVLSAPLHERTIYQVLNLALWDWTEKLGSDKTYPIRSEKLIIAEKTQKCDVQTVHEHAVPRKVIIGKIVDIENPSEEAVREVLLKFAHAAIITKEEDDILNKFGFRSSMPKAFYDESSEDFENPWLRYKTCNITIVDTRSNTQLSAEVEV